VGRVDLLPSWLNPGKKNAFQKTLEKCRGNMFSVIVKTTLVSYTELLEKLFHWVKEYCGGSFVTFLQSCKNLDVCSIACQDSL